MVSSRGRAARWIPAGASSTQFSSASERHRRSPLSYRNESSSRSAQHPRTPVRGRTAPAAPYPDAPSDNIPTYLKPTIASSQRELAKEHARSTSPRRSQRWRSAAAVQWVQPNGDPQAHADPCYLASARHRPSRSRSRPPQRRGYKANVYQSRSERQVSQRTELSETRILHVQRPCNSVHDGTTTLVHDGTTALLEHNLANTMTAASSQAISVPLAPTRRTEEELALPLPPNRKQGSSGIPAAMFLSGNIERKGKRPSSPTHEQRTYSSSPFYHERSVVTALPADHRTGSDSSHSALPMRNSRKPRADDVTLSDSSKATTAPLGSFLHKPSGSLYKGKGSASTGALYKSLDRDEISAEISAVHESNELDEGIDVHNVLKESQGIGAPSQPNLGTLEAVASSTVNAQCQRPLPQARHPQERVPSLGQMEFGPLTEDVLRQSLVQAHSEVVTHQGSALPYLADHDPEPLPPVHPPGWTLVSAPPILHPSADAAMQQRSNPPIRASDEQHRAPAFLDGDTPVFYPHGAPIADGGLKPEHHGIPVNATPGSGTMNTDDGRASLRTSFLQWDAPNSTNAGTDDKPVERRAPKPAPETSTSPTHTSPTQWTKQDGAWRQVKTVFSSLTKNVQLGARSTVTTLSNSALRRKKSGNKM